MDSVLAVRGQRGSRLHESSGADERAWTIRRDPARSALRRLALLILDQGVFEDGKWTFESLLAKAHSHQCGCTPQCDEAGKLEHPPDHPTCFVPATRRRDYPRSLGSFRILGVQARFFEWFQVRDYGFDGNLVL